MPPPATGGRRAREILAGFRVYLTPGGVGEGLPAPRVYTCYRGVPVASEARVVDADEQRVTLKASQYQANVLALTGFALVNSPLHGTTFQAWTGPIDAQACLVSFERFDRHEPGARRINVRVAPDAPIRVALTSGGHALQGALLLDLSVAALAVLVPDADPSLVREGAEVAVDVDLPDAGAAAGFRLRARGAIGRVLAWAGDDPNDFRAVVHLAPDDALRARIGAYVTEQQTEILAELGRAGPG